MDEPTIGPRGDRPTVGGLLWLVVVAVIALAVVVAIFYLWSGRTFA